MNILKNETFDKSKYMVPSKIDTLKRFVLDFNSFTLTQNLSKVNHKIDRLKRR